MSGLVRERDDGGVLRREIRYSDQWSGYSLWVQTQYEGYDVDLVLKSDGECGGCMEEVPKGDEG